MTPSTLKGHDCFISIPFLTIFNAPNAPIRRVQVLFRHQKQWSPPLRSSLSWTLKCYSCKSICDLWTTKRFNPYVLSSNQIPCYKLYKEGLFSYVLTLKYMCHFGMSLKKLNLKVKHKIKNQIHGYSPVHFVLCFSTYDYVRPS